MKKFFVQLFDDNNSINEKSVVGFIAFFFLCIAFLIDIITGYAGKEFVVNKIVDQLGLEVNFWNIGS
jgi:hypothetical protein